MANEQQAAYWNGEAGARWVRRQACQDEVYAPLTQRLLAVAGLGAADAVLDVGCGCGGTTLAAGRQASSAVGIDLSVAMLQHARRQAAGHGLGNVSFFAADAQTHPLSGFDVVISRFGVMFFDDPVAAFANLAAAGQRLAFVCWRAAADIPFFRVPALALAAHIPPPEPGPPGAPGPFALADRERIGSVLTAAGLADVQIEPADVALRLGGSAAEAVEFLRGSGPVHAALASADPGTAQRALASVTEALAPHANGAGVHLDAATWLVTARRG
jgi:SAM-dependent methyltransferase